MSSDAIVYHLIFTHTTNVTSRRIYILCIKFKIKYIMYKVQDYDSAFFITLHTPFDVLYAMVGVILT